MKPNGEPHGPWHDATTAVDGKAAYAIGAGSSQSRTRMRSLDCGAALTHAATASIAEFDERRRRDREQLQARLRGEKPTE